MTKRKSNTSGRAPAKAKPTAETLKPAKGFAASGAVIEEEIVDRVDMSHPAVDSNPRERSTADMNRIDFNDPTKSQEEAVIDNLKEQGAEPQEG